MCSTHHTHIALCLPAVLSGLSVRGDVTLGGALEVNSTLAVLNADGKGRRGHRMQTAGSCVVLVEMALH